MPLSVAEVEVMLVTELVVAVGLTEEELELEELQEEELLEEELGLLLNTAQTETSPLGLFTSTTQLLPLSHHPTPFHLSKE